jgi:hypothetical protein
MAHDRLDAQALRAERLYLLIPFPCPPGQRGVRGPLLRGRGGSLLQVSRGFLVCGRLLPGFWFFQAVPVPGHRLLHMPAQVVVQVPAVGDLDRVWRAGACAVGVGAGPVPADDLGAWMVLQPAGERVRLAVAQQVHGLAGLRVDQHGAVVATAAEREVVHPEDRHGAWLGIGQRHDQPQQAGPAGEQVQQHGEP